MREAVSLFLALGTQWRWTGMGMAGAFQTGLDYSVIAPTAAALKIDMTPTVFNDIRVMELEALRVWARKRV